MSCPAVRQPWDEEWIVAGRHGELRIRATTEADARLLTLGGVLDGVTYIPLRDAIVKAALDEPLAVIIDVTALTVREEPVWSVFTSARWQIAEWPDVPIGLVCAHDHGQTALRRNGITRYVPAYRALRSAITELLDDGVRRDRRRARASLPPVSGSIHRSRELAAQWLTAWSRSDFVHAVSIVATELVETALVDTDRPFSLRVETEGSTVAVAVQHVSTAKALRQEFAGETVSGLDLVDANCRTWGRYTTGVGNTAWALVGPENRF
jgi:hypothetical protein